MRLSRLEIKGFKSFGDKVIFQFDRGVSGIVGPNGCGKSNVVDAIRWVLGEQKTRALRSDKMENVIFNGSKNRKPTQLAEVTITFDNDRGLLPTAYATVTVTRRYYRTGESEYLLNGVACRLKDITDLFLDTGIGPDSYAIIELRMVDELLNDKENARRLLFEEAAGVSKFRVRRKQTMKKLDETDGDLTRVEDVLAELQRNLKSLERQAKLSQRFNKLRAEYRALSLAYARRAVAHYSENLARLHQQLTQETTRRQGFAREAFDLERSLDGYQKQIESARAALDAQRTATAETGFKLREADTAHQQRTQRLAHLLQRAHHLRQVLHQESRQADQTTRELAALSQRLTTTETELAAGHDHLAHARTAQEAAQQARATALHTLQQAQNRQRAAQQTAFQKQKDAEIAQLQAQTTRRELEQLHLRQRQEADATTRQADELTRAETALATATAHLTHLQEAERRRHDDLAHAEAALLAATQALAPLQRQLDAKRNQLALTQALVENLEGFPKASRFLYKAGQAGHWAAAPLLSDLLTTEPAAKAAIAAYLEPWLPCFVVESVADAEAAVALLQRDNKGRAGFLLRQLSPLQLPEAQPADRSQSPLPTEAQPARAVVQVADARYAPLVDLLLRDVYLTDAPLAALPDDGRTWLQRDGGAVRRPGGLSGGAVGTFAGARLGRRQELAALTGEVADLNAQVQGQQTVTESARQQVQTLRAAARPADLRQAEQTVQTTARAQQAALVRGEQADANRQRGAHQLAELTQRLTAQEARLTERHPELVAARTLLAEADVAVQTTSTAADAATQHAAERGAGFNQLNLRQHQLQNQVQATQQEAAYKRAAAEAAAQRADQHRTELTQHEAEADGLRVAVAEAETTLAHLRAARTDSQQTLATAETAYLTTRGDAEAAERQRRDRERQRGLADEATRQLQEKVSDMRLQLVAVRERLAAEFNLELGPDDALPEQEPGSAAAPEPATLNLAPVPLDELNRRVLDVRRRLEALGPVNPLAHEAYAEIQERDTFIRTERDDLLAAKNTLLATIAELDTVAKERYLAAFGQIKEHFARVFRSLFDEGDSCDLVIVNPHDPLDSRIEIMARPKGKRPLTINQLSGGEKTLTAISLLFAIYLLKPAPFCIFDEVDAPLDDANIDKFNRIIQEFSAQSQFIIVTHNKRTMAAADVLYGVTMTEPGVSRALPVDLRAVAA